MKKLLKEFKEFAVKGNIIDLAVGVIIGGAFQRIVSSFVNDLIMPLISLITGGENLNGNFTILKLPDGVTRDQVTTLANASELGVVTFNYGSFISGVIDFLIMAIVVFLMIKLINKFKNMAVCALTDPSKEPAPEPPKTKKCIYCLSEIPYKATRCSQCTSELPSVTENTAEEFPETD